MFCTKFDIELFKIDGVVQEDIGESHEILLIKGQLPWEVSRGKGLQLHLNQKKCIGYRIIGML